MLSIVRAERAEGLVITLAVVPQHDAFAGQLLTDGQHGPVNSHSSARALRSVRSM